MKKLLSVIAIVSVACMSAIGGETGVWTNNVAASGYWTTSSNWKNAYVPTNSNDSASFPSDVPVDDVKVNPIRTITMPDKSLTLDTLSGTAGNTLVGQATPRTFSFLDAADFAGTFKLASPHTIAFRSAAGETANVRNINVVGKPIVSNADGTIEAASIYGNGRFDKRGAGTLRILSGGGPQTRLTVRNASTVELAGAPSGIDASSLDGLPAPASWLDASEPGSLTIENGQVTKWIDKRDAAAGTTGRKYLKQSTDSNVSRLPTLAPAAANGRDAVDFGAIGSGTAMQFSTDFGNGVVAELFIAYENNSPTNHGILFGDTSNKKYNGKATSAFDGAMFSADLGYQPRLGEIRRDHNRIWWDDAVRPRGGFHTLMISNSGSGHRFNTIGYCRGVSTGGVKVGEAIVYSTHLTADERRRVLRYLAQKWCSGDNAEDWELGGVQLGAATTLSVPDGRKARVQTITTSAAKSLTVAGGGTLETALIGNPPKGRRGGKQNGAFNTADPMPVSVLAGTTLRLVTGVAADADAPLPEKPYLHLDASQPDTITESDGKVTEWRDVRSGSTMKAVAVNGSTTAVKRRSGGMNGRDIVSTGDLYGSAGGSGLDIYSGSTAVGQDATTCREAFIAGRAIRAGDDWGRALFLANNNLRLFWPGQDDGGDKLGGLITGYYNFTKINEGCTPAQLDNYIALDGVPVDPSTYVMITNPVVISVAFNASQKFNALARYGTANRGGVEYGEVIVYNRSLTPQERRNIEAYLLKKWRGIETHPENAPSRTGAMSLASGATLDIAEGAGLAVQGNLSVADGATLSFDLASGTSAAPLTASGTVSFAGAATIRVDFDGSCGEHPLIAASAISGDFANLSLALPASANGNAKLKQSGGNLVLRYTMPGLVLFVR